jgi:hypothetical protein
LFLPGIGLAVSLQCAGLFQRDFSLAKGMPCERWKEGLNQEGKSMSYLPGNR